MNENLKGVSIKKAIFFPNERKHILLWTATLEYMAHTVFLPITCP